MLNYMKVLETKETENFTGIYSTPNPPPKKLVTNC